MIDSLDMVRDLLDFKFGHDVDSDFSAVQARETPEDYVIITKRGDEFWVHVYDTPATILRNLGVLFSTTKTKAQFWQKTPSTKKRKYGK